MMEEDVSRRTEEETLRAAASAVSSRQVFSGTTKEITVGDLNTAESPVDNIRNYAQIDSSSHEKSKAYAFSCPAEKKTHGTLTVLYTSPSKTHFYDKVNVLAADSSGKGSSVVNTVTGSTTVEQRSWKAFQPEISAKIDHGSRKVIQSDVSSKLDQRSGNIFQQDISAKIYQGPGKIFQPDISAKSDQGSRTVFQSDISARSGQLEHYLSDGTSGEISIIERIAHNTRRANAKSMEHVDSASVFKGISHASFDAPTHWNSSHAMQAIYESNKNNNNNIDKSGETYASVTLPSLDWKKTQKYLGDETWCQVPQREMEKSSVHSLRVGDIGVPNLTECALARSMALPINLDQSAGLLLKSDIGAGQRDASIGLKSFNQSFPTVSRTVMEPKLSVTVHCTPGFSASATRTVDSFTKAENRVSTAFTSQHELVTSTLTDSTAAFMHGNSTAIQQCHDVFGSQTMDTCLSQSSVSINRTEVETPSNGNKITLNQNKCFVQQLVLRHPNETSDHFKAGPLSLGQSRTVAGQPNTSADNLLSISSTYLSNFSRQSPSFAQSHSKAAQNSLSSVVPSSSAGNQLLVTHCQPFGSNNSAVSSSVLVGKLRENISKSTKKPRSKNPKPKSQKTPFLRGDEEDDDLNNDFIPVGMLQLSGLKKPDGGADEAVDNAVVLSAEKSMRSHYQLNLGLNVMYEQQVPVRRDGQALPAEKSSHHEGNEYVNEKLKQKVQQNKLKVPVGEGQQQGSQLQMLAQSVKVQEQDVQQHGSHQQHQLLMQLVQHAQKQLQDQQQPQNTLNLASSGMAKTASFSKNQGLIIHHQQSQDAKAAANVKGLSPQTVVRVCSAGPENGGDRQFKKEVKLEQNTQQSAEINYKAQDKTFGIEKLQKAQQKDQRYPQHHSLAAFPSGKNQQETSIMHKELPWQVQPSNIPKIAERLLQQSVSEQMMQPSRAEQLFCKIDQLAQPSPQASTSKSDQIVTSRPMTPTTAIAHHATPSVNQQHPEIARMLNSPVSPRQPASPRQSVSPRGTISPIQPTTSMAQFVSPRQVVTPHPRQSTSLLQSGNPKHSVSLQPASPYQPAGQKVTSGSQQSWQTSNLAYSSTSPAQFVSSSHSQPFTGHTLSVQLKDQAQVRQTRVDLNQSTSLQLEESPFSDSGLWKDGGKVKQLAIDRHQAAPDFSISLSSSDPQQLSSAQLIPLNQPVQSFSPGQVIHHRPQERRNAHGKVLNVPKSQPSISVQFSSPSGPSATQTMPTVKVHMPSIQNTSPEWHSLPVQVKSLESAVQQPKPTMLHSSQSVNIHKLDEHPQQQKTNESHEQNQLNENTDVGYLHSLTSQIHASSRPPVCLSASFQHQIQGAEKNGIEMQMYPSSAQFIPPVSTFIDSKPINSYVVSSTHDRNFQSIADLTEKETSFLQSLFANDLSVETNERAQTNLIQTPHVLSQMQTSFSSLGDTSKICEDSLRLYTNTIPLYPEIRKNEGGLKVLSEIASERYALAVAGKDDMIDLQINQPVYQAAPQSTPAVPETVDQNNQPSINEAPSLKTKHSSGVENYSVSKKRAANSPAKADISNDIVNSEPETQNNLSEKETKELFLTYSETPRREVRQRKPKKPFEQDDTPVKRSPKTPQQRNCSSQKEIPVAPTHNPSHKKGQSQKAAQAKLKEETEQEETKQKTTRQTRLTAEDRIAEDKLRDKSMENVEDTKHAKNIQLDSSSSRRLSRRLQVKEKERLESPTVTDDTKITRLNRTSGWVDYKEEAVELVEESVSARSTRSKRQASISSVDETVTPETPEKMTTRSKNRNVDIKTTPKSDPKVEVNKQISENLIEEKKSINTPKKNVAKPIVFSSDMRRDTRSQSKSPGRGSRSRSPARLNNASSSSGKASTSQGVTKVDRLGSSVVAKVKRSLPPETMEELPLSQKRVKKLDAPTNTQESHKPVGKSGGFQAEAPKESLKVEDVEMAIDASILETQVVGVKQNGTKKGKNKKKKKNRQKVPEPAPREDLKSDSYEGDEEATKRDLKEDSKLQDSKMKTNSENTERDLDSIFPNVKEKQSLELAEESSKTNIYLKDKMEDFEADRHKDERPQEALMKAEPKTTEQLSVIRSTSTFSVVQSIGSIESSIPSSASAETSSDDKSFSNGTLLTTRPKLVMYKLVPVMDEDMCDLEESLVPVISYYIRGGSSDRIFLPHNFMEGPVASKVSSSSTTVQATSLSLSSQILSNDQTLVKSLSSTVSDLVLPPDAANASSLASNLFSSASVTTAYSPLRTALCSTVGQTLPSTVWSLQTHQPTSSATHPSAWTSHLPQTVPLSTGDSSSVLGPAKSWTSTPPQASPLQYKPSPSWNTTSPSVPSSSPLPMSSSVWNSSSTPPVSQRHEPPQQSWTASSQQVPQESSWRSSPSVTAAALESWSREFFPSTVLANTLSQRPEEPITQGSTQNMTSSGQNVLLTSGGYTLGTGSSQQPQMYTSNHDHAMSSSTLYSSSAAQDSEFTDNRQDSVIQGFLRQVSSNPGGFSQELTGFNLGQQDLAFLENRLRQTLSPNTLFSAVAAYDDNSGHGPVVSHDSSLEESISLVHTVNLDMEESQVDGSVNLDLSDLGSVNVPRNLDGQGTNRSHQEEDLAQVSVAESVGDSSQHDESGDVSGDPKSDGKKPIRERKSQYEIVIENGVKRYKCLVCGKNFGVATIYRHLRIHDPDYKVRCSLCGKQYSQRHSLIMHWWKLHGVKAKSAGMEKGPKSKEITSSEQDRLEPSRSPSSQGKSPKVPLNFPGAQGKSANDLLKSQGTEEESHNVPFKSLDSQVKSPNVPFDFPNVEVGSPNVLLKFPDTEGKLPNVVLKLPNTEGKSPNVPLVLQETSLKSPDEFKRQRKSPSTSGTLPTGHEKPELSKQQMAHQQVEELRRLKAEKKLAAAQRKAVGSSLEDAEDGPFRSTSNSEHFADDDMVDLARDNTASSASYSNTQAEQSSVVYEPRDIQDASYPSSSNASSLVADSSRISTHVLTDYENPLARKLQVMGAALFQFNSPHQGMATVPQFHADNIPKPISTPIVKSSLCSESDSLKDAVSLEDGSQLKNGRGGSKHVCEICSTQLNSKSGYILHMRRHNQIKTKFCSFCDKGFHTGQELRSHERTHTGEKPYRCEICHTSFAHSGSFVSHKKGHEKRGERDPFPIVDGEIVYPSTFKKPRLSCGTGEKPRRVKKPKQKMAISESADSEHLSQKHNLDSQQTSVIQRQNLDNSLSNEQTDSPHEDFEKNIPGRWQSLAAEQRLNAESFKSSMESPTLNDHSAGSRGLRMGTASQDIILQEQDSRGYAPSGDSYSSSAGNVASEYYSNPAGYSQSIQQQEFLSPHVDTPSSPHGFYKQDKYYPRSSSVDTYPANSRIQTASMPVNLTIEKSHHYSGSHNFSDSGQGSGSYYSPQQHSSEYHYNVPPQSESADYQEEDYEDSLSQYKNDTSSSEIVKKLLQHYNVPTSTFQETLPLDYSHQMQESSDYDRIGHNSVAEYSGLGVGRSTPAPPPYSASIRTQDKCYYSSQSNTSDYNSGIAQQQSTMTVQEQSVMSPHETQQQQMLQPHLIQDDQFRSSNIQSHAQEMYSSDSRYSTAQSYPNTHFTNPSLAQPTSPSHSQRYEIEPSLSQEYFSHPLPKFESLAREPTDSPSTENN